jgi:hypothetical protein
MRRMLGWTVAATALGALAGQGCGGGSNTPTTSASSGAGGMTGSTTGSTTGSGAGGTGTGGSASGPFTSKGASSYEAQTSVAANDQGAVVAAWIGFFADNTSAIGYAVSRDAGATWTAPAYAHSPGGRLASNPVVAIDGQGRASLAWLGFKPDFNAPDEHVYLARLDDKTETFGAPALASDDGTSTTRDFDKPSIAVDANDDVLLTWADFTGANPLLTFARTSDGASFTRSTVVSDTSFGNLASLCFDASAGPSAKLFLVHLGAGGTITLRTSVDQGKTWQLGPVVSATQVVFQDVGCVAHGSDLWISYASGSAMFNSGMDSPGDAVSVVHSANGGAQFSAPVTVSSGPSGQQYLFPSFARAPSGKLEIAYYQGGVGQGAGFILATSSDGATWTTSPIGPAGTFTVDRTLASWLGEYTGLAVTATSTFVTFTENSAGKDHVSFAKVAAP